MPRTNSARQNQSWQLFPNRLRQQKLRDEETQPGRDARRKEIAVLLIFFYRDRRFLELVDVAKDLLQRFCVGGAIELPVRNPGHLLEPRFVKMHWLVLIKNVAKHVGDRLAVLRIENRRGRDAVDPGTDRVEVDLQSLHCFGGSVRRNFRSEE